MIKCRNTLVILWKCSNWHLIVMKYLLIAGKLTWFLNLFDFLRILLFLNPLNLISLIIIWWLTVPIFIRWQNLFSGLFFLRFINSQYWRSWIFIQITPYWILNNWSNFIFFWCLINWMTFEIIQIIRRNVWIHICFNIFG